MGWLIPRQDLSKEQIRAVELSTASHRVIVGAPGSGKTQILLHRAACLREDHGTPTDKFRIFVFTNVLKDYIRAALGELGLPETNVSTFDDWCKRTYEEVVSRHVPWNQSEHRPDFAVIRHDLLPALRGKPARYDYVLVDEGQDLDPECFEIVRLIARHVTVCLDHKQQIYDHGSSYETVIAALGLRRSDLTLLEAFRCCPYIVEVSAEFIDDLDERQAFLNQSRTTQSEKLTPLLYEASGFEDESDNMVAIVKERLLVDRSIAILFPLKKQVEGFANAFRKADMQVETQRTGLNFSNNVPKLITIHSAKGLTFDTVLLPRLVPGSFPRFSDARIRRMLYVGITRATKWVYLSTYSYNAIPQLEPLRALVTRKPTPITITSDPLPQMQAHSAAVGSDDDPFGLL